MKKTMLDEDGNVTEYSNTLRTSEQNMFKSFRDEDSVVREVPSEGIIKKIKRITKTLDFWRVLVVVLSLLFLLVVYGLVGVIVMMIYDSQFYLAVSLMALTLLASVHLAVKYRHELWMFIRKGVF